MPLKQSTSKRAFSQNVATEMRAGRPQAQSVAIAYSEKRRAERKGPSRRASVFMKANRV
jgi:hypothetical protein